MTRSEIGFVVMMVILGVSDARAQGAPVFNNLPDVVPGNVPSAGFQACLVRADFSAFKNQGDCVSYASARN